LLQNYSSALLVAKDVRTQTEIGANLVSMGGGGDWPSVYPTIEDQRVFFGAGEMVG